MTNLIATLVITVSTNWSGAYTQNKEVGFISTNYAAECVFDGKTNRFTLEDRTAFDVVAWRDKPAQTVIGFHTNSWSIPNQPYVIPHQPYIWSR